MTLRTIIVDDEPLARRGIRSRLAAYPEFEIAGEAGGGTEAVRLLRSVSADVLFLDVQMPGLDGFGVLRELGDAIPRHVVFVTAWDAFAVEAFRVRALDYLLKPVEAERFRETVARILAATAGGEEIAGAIRQLLRSVQAPLRRIAVRHQDKTVLVPLDDISRIEAEHDYVRLVTARGSHLHRATMTSLAGQLDERFLRVHRSAIVRMDLVAEVHPLPGGESVLVMRDGTRVRSGRSYREAVQRAFGD